VVTVWVAVADDPLTWISPPDTPVVLAVTVLFPDGAPVTPRAPPTPSKWSLASSPLSMSSTT
jgi:hypothetical protein